MNRRSLIKVCSASALACVLAAAQAEERALRNDPGARVTVYGRDTCGYTRTLVAVLDEAGVPFRYRRSNDPATRRELVAKMDAAGVPDGPFKLPVVEFDGRIEFRPDPDGLAARARAAGP
jgi:glutaredoxin